MKTVWILGTSSDLNKLGHGWWLGKDTIGINSSYMAASRDNTQLTEWISHDQYYAFHPWLYSNTHALTRKWVLCDYKVDERLGVFWPRQGAPVNEKFKDSKVRFYRLQRHATPKLCPQIPNSELTQAVEFAVLDDYIFTIFTAISLAVGLGYNDIRLRGVSFQGDYFNEELKIQRDNYYYEIYLKFKKWVLPALKELNIPLTNETEQAQWKIKDWQITDK